jgi:hypothetical protein
MRDWANVLFIRTLMTALRVVALVADLPPRSIYFKYRGPSAAYTLAPRTGQPSGKS